MTNALTAVSPPVHQLLACKFIPVPPPSGTSFALSKYLLVIVVDVMSATSFDSVKLASNPEIVISSPSAVYVLVKKLVT